MVAGHVFGGDPDLQQAITVSFGVADAYHSMISPRPHREAKSRREALTELRLKAGTQFDPAVVEAFLAALELGLDEGGKSSAAGQDAVPAGASTERG